MQHKILYKIYKVCQTKPKYTQFNVPDQHLYVPVYKIVIRKQLISAVTMKKTLRMHDYTMSGAWIHNEHSLSDT